MSNQATKASIEDSIALFDESGLLIDSNVHVALPSSHAKVLRNKTYVEQFDEYKRNYWFHLVLLDGSFLLFEEDSYRYMMCPVKLPTESEYIESLWGDDWAGLSHEDQQSMIESSDFAQDYEKFIETEAEFGSYTPVRYDIHSNNEEHCAYSHPALHLHIGFENNSRIPVKKKLTQLAFSSFILSTFYPSQWKELNENNHSLNEKLNNIKQNLMNISHVDQELWCERNEESRLFLG